MSCNMNQIVYGYARVSTAEQNLDRQLIALRAAGVPEANIFADKKSGKDFNRPAWKRLVRKLKTGDLLVVKSIDRFGRSYDEIIVTWDFLSRRKKVHLRVLDMPLLDTTTAQGLLAVFIANLVLQILSFVAETERQQIKARQREGIAAAKASMTLKMVICPKKYLCASLLTCAVCLQRPFGAPFRTHHHECPFATA